MSEKAKALAISTFVLKFGALAPSIEEQLNAYGLTLGGKAQKIEKIRNAILMVKFHVASETETDKMFKRLMKLVEKEMKEMIKHE